MKICRSAQYLYKHFRGTAEELVDKLMEQNPTIPSEAREQLIFEETRRRINETIREEGPEHYE